MYEVGLVKEFTTIMLLLVSILCVVRAEWQYSNSSITEGSRARTFVSRIQSTNESTVSYSIDGDFTDEFAVSRTDGVIYTSGLLDRERKSEYTVILMAFDKDKNPTEIPSILRIIVTDVNDEYPVFLPSSLNATIGYEHRIGDAVMSIAATDKDLSENGKIFYSIERNSEVPTPTSGDRFEIDAETGVVKLVGSLNNTIAEYRFQVTATDNGAPVKNKVTSEAIIKVVNFTNKHAPVIQLAEVQLPEFTEVGTIVYTLIASDEDHEGVNRMVYFEIIAGNTNDTFEIVSVPAVSGPSSGVIKLSKRLDYESGLLRFVLTLKAYNKEALNADDDTYATLSALKIRVIDANEPPVFIHTPYSGVVTEGNAPQSVIPIITASAVDLDFGGIQTISYSLSEPENWFYINPQSGDISLTGAVDRESPSVVDGVYRFDVIATDNYYNGPYAVAKETVTITIIDVNDNPPTPVWDHNGANVTICEKPKNNIVKVIKATDPDSDANGPKFYFKLTDSVDQSRWGFQELDNETQAVIAKFSDYGLVSQSETVELIFTITDSGSVPQTSTATLTVNICKCNDATMMCSSYANRIVSPYLINLSVATLFIVSLLP